jgi:hypothetical protein
MSPLASKIPKIHALMLVGRVLVLLPMVGVQRGPDMIGLAVVFSGLQLINVYQQWVTAKHWRYFLITALMSVALWGMTQIVHHYDCGKQLQVGIMFIYAVGLGRFIRPRVALSPQTNQKTHLWQQSR